MPVTILVVVHADRHADFTDAAGTVTGVALDWAVYQHEGEVRELVRGRLDGGRVDGVFLGPVPFDACHDLLPDDLPVTVLRPAALDLALALFRARTDHPRLAGVSIDTFEPEVVAEVTAAMGLDAGSVHVVPPSIDESAAISEDHVRALDRGGSVITARMAVARSLRHRLPVIQTRPMISTVRAELHGLALRLQSRHATAQRFTAAVFLVADSTREFDVERSRIGLMNLLVNDPDYAEAWVEDRGRRGVVLLGHKALFERVTHQWLTVPALARAEETLGLRVSAGFGIGSSARTCVSLAERAATRAEAEPGSAAYLIEDTGVIIGPMGRDGGSVAFTYRDHGDRLEQLARGVGLSTVTLSRLAAIERGLEGRAISPGDLAEALGITDPSGRRLIRKLGERGLVSATGSVQTHRKGRPTTLYRLGIDAALDDN